MGQLDFKLKYVCTSTKNTIESFMFNNNKTYDWLNEKSECERKGMTHISRKRNRNFSVEYKKRREHLFQRHVHILREKAGEKAEDSRKKKNEIERALKDIDKIGLWETDHQVEEELSKLK